MEGVFRKRLAVVLGLALVASALAAACGGSPDAPVKPKPKGAAEVNDFDPCEGSKPPWRNYTSGPLVSVRCEQEQFLRMADFVDALGVDCGYCHAEKGAGYDYEAWIEKKRVSFWMHENFVEGLKQVDGKPVKCKSCHVDEKKKAAAKLLGAPRDVTYSVEWMCRVMTNKFTLQDGSKLKCKHCHEAAWGEPEFNPKVILRKLSFAPDAVEPPPVGAPPPPPAPSTPPAKPAAPKPPVKKP